MDGIPNLTGFMEQIVTHRTGQDINENILECHIPSKHGV